MPSEMSIAVVDVVDDVGESCSVIQVLVVVGSEVQDASSWLADPHGKLPVAEFLEVAENRLVMHSQTEHEVPVSLGSTSVPAEPSANGVLIWE